MNTLPLWFVCLCFAGLGGVVWLLIAGERSTQRRPLRLCSVCGNPAAAPMVRHGANRPHRAAAPLWLGVEQHGPPLPAAPGAPPTPSPARRGAPCTSPARGAWPSRWRPAAAPGCRASDGRRRTSTYPRGIA